MQEKMILVILLLLIICVLISHYNKQELSEQVYAIITYLYIFGSLLVIYMTCLIIEEYGLLNKLSSYGFLFFVFIFSFVTLFGTILTSTKSYMKNGFFLLFLISLGTMSYYVYKLAIDKNIFTEIIMIIGTMFIAISLFFNYYPIEKINSIGNYLFFCLLGLIVIEVIDLIFGSKTGLLYRYKLYSYVSVCLFTVFLIYDTQNIRQTFLMKYGSEEFPDYPVQSLSITLDIVNLFSSIVNIKN